MLVLHNSMTRCRRLQESGEKGGTSVGGGPSGQHEAEIASMALAVLVRLTANAGNILHFSCIPLLNLVVHG